MERKKELGYELDKKDGPGYIVQVKTLKKEFITYHITYYSGEDRWSVISEEFDKKNMLETGLCGDGWKYLYFAP